MYPQITIPVIVWGLYAGLVAASVLATLVRTRTRAVIDAMLAAGAVEPDRAKTADEMELTASQKRVLCSSLYGKLFICANADEAVSKKPKNPYDKPKLDLARARFYLPKDREFEAKERFSRTPIAALVVAVALLTVAFVALRFALPLVVGVVEKVF